MDVLKKLFEEHFHRPVVRVEPLQGELGGSGRSVDKHKIIGKALECKHVLPAGPGLPEVAVSP